MTLESLICMSKSINIKISEDVWRKLNYYKNIGDSYDSVLRRVFKLPPIEKRNRKSKPRK